MSQKQYNKWLILSAVVIGSIMGPIDGSIVNIAMPEFTKIFHTNITTVSWVSMTYLLVLSSLMMTFGRLGDMLGYKKTVSIRPFDFFNIFCDLESFCKYIYVNNYASFPSNRSWHANVNDISYYNIRVSSKRKR